jgi:hypothetical protein
MNTARNDLTEIPLLPPPAATKHGATFSRRLSMRNTLLVTILGLGLAAPLLADDPKPIDLSIYARAIDSPALKYRLLPSEAELKAGNAVPILLRLPWEETAYFYETFRTLSDWESRPLTAPEWKEFPKAFPDKFYDEMKRAAFRRDASWEYPIGEQPAYFILLPDMQGLRALVGYGLSGRARYHMIRGELDEARETILVGLANGRHLAQTPFFVNQLVAGIVHGAMLDRVADLIAQPNSPNLYWALSTLPDSLLALDRAASLEANAFGMTFPAANDLERPRSADEWNKMLDQLLELLQLDQGPRLSPKQIEARRAEFIQLARVEVGPLLKTPAEKVATMSDSEAAVRWYVRTREPLDQLAAAILCLKPREAWPRLTEFNAQVEAISQKQKMTKLEFFNPTSTYVSAWSVKRKIEALRIIEAVRHYLSTHDGKLPRSLADIETLSIPTDPLTDLPFEWTVDGQTATLKATFLPTNSAKFSVEHRINFVLHVK